MNKEQLQNLLNQKYDAANWNKIYGSIFPNVMLFSSPKEIAVTENWVKSFKQRGLVRLQGNQDVAIFEVILKDGISVQSKRVGLRNLVAKLIDEYQNHGVLAVFDNGSPEYRFTFAAKETKVTREGIEKTETDSKRYTYILGETETCKTAAEQFIKLSEKGSTISLSDLQEAFSVEKLSKQFFNEYKEQYNYFVSYLASQPKILKSVFADDEKKMRDFVKLLLGRLVFLRFVQKKRWLGVPAKNTDWSSGDVKFLVNTYKAFSKKEKYYSDFLEELFFECLNSPNRKNELFSITGTKVPFLNGGLFENDNPQTKSINFPVSYFDGLFDFFGRYNFTIDENDPTEKEVGIDPEMLGSIFENLLEDNKDKGAFYTPKEIVHYMCQESLIQYLCTKVNTENDEKVASSIRNLITKRKIDERVTGMIKSISVALREVKICDPAIGSGAFPMGMLMEIFHCVFELYNANPKVVSKEWNMNGWQANVVKSNIIQNSIYGVDIEKGAVDIARLRFWLSLVVDEDEPKPLPNLDYKIVVGDSLVSKFEGEIIEIDWEIKEGTQSNLFGNENVLKRQQLLKEITQKQKEYFYGKEKKKLAELIRNLKIDILINQLQLMINVKGVESNSSKHKNKKHSFLMTQTQCWKTTIKKLEGLRRNSDEYFEHFDWKLDFPEILNQSLAKGNVGFDIVIANPPYIGQKGNNKLFQEVKSTNFGKEFHQRRMDYFYFFFHHAINICKQKGVINFITTNYYITATYADILRKDIKNRTSVRELVNFNEAKIFESALGQHNIITILTKGVENYPIKVINCKRKGFATPEILRSILYQNDSETQYLKLPNQNIFEGNLNYMRLQPSDSSDVGIESILNKIKAQGKPLSEICDITQGIVTGADKLSKSHIEKYGVDGTVGDGIFALSAKEVKKLGLNQSEKQFLKPWFKNSDISKWITNEQTEESLIYYTSKAENKIGYTLLKHFEHYKTILINRNTRSGTPIITSSVYDRFVKGQHEISYVMVASAFKRGEYYCVSYARDKVYFESPKIVVPQRSSLNTFGYNESNWYAASDVHFIIQKNSNYLLKFILALLNSKLYFKWLYHRGKRKGETLELVLAPLSEIPIKLISNKTQVKISKLVDKIISAKTNNIITKTIEQEIDNLVYKVYELTHDEVKVIDPEFELSKDEYDNIELE